MPSETAHILNPNFVAFPGAAVSVDLEYDKLDAPVGRNAPLKTALSSLTARRKSLASTRQSGGPDPKLN